MGRVPKEGKRKQVKDPNKPKRGTSAYFYFIAEKRVEAKEAGKKISKVAEWTKAMSVLWRDLDEDRKNTFDAMAQKDKLRYQEEMAEYTGKRVDANKPKRALSAYFLWLADFRTKMKGEFDENKELLRAAGEEWRNLDDEEKAPYEKTAAEGRKRYEIAMKEYVAENPPPPKAPKQAAKKAPAPAKNGASKNGHIELSDDDEDEEEEEEEEEDEEEAAPPPKKVFKPAPVPVEASEEEDEEDEEDEEEEEEEEEEDDE